MPISIPEINAFFERALAWSPDGITFLVCTVCVVLFFFSLFSKKLREIAPALMVSAGIIGTFWGTFVALSYFETGAQANGGVDITLSRKAMVESIPKVLGGMKSAFVTSLIGLLSAFVSKIFFTFLPKLAPKPLPIEENTLNLLREIKDGIAGEGDKSLSSQLSNLQTEYRDGAKDIKQSISGDSESSIALQLIKLRNETSDGFKALDGRLSGLTEVIRDSLVKSMDALMKELREIIVNQLTEQLRKTNELLRQQLTEMLDRIEEALIKQFGETFKQFNEATQAIKKWQEDHREQVEQLTKAFEMTAQGIEKIRTNCESIPALMEKLQTLMGELDERLRAFAEMKDAAEKSFPVLKEHLDAIGADLRESAAGFAGLEKTITDTYTHAGKLAQQHIKVAQEHIENMGKQINLTAEKVTATATDMMEQSNKATDQHRENIRQNIAEMKDAFQSSAQHTEQALSEMSRKIGKQSTDVIQHIGTTAESAINEGRNAATQQRAAILAIVAEIQRASEQCVLDTQNTLTELAQNHAQTISNAMTVIAERWGENMLSIANEMVRLTTTKNR